MAIAAVLPLVDSAGEGALTLSAAVAAPAPQLGPNLVTNGDFSGGTTGWLEFATPNQSFMVSTTSGGVYQFFRNPPPAGTANQATLFQETGAAIPAYTALTAQFDLGNSSSVRKRISTLVLNFDFSDLSVCTFFLEPNTPLRTYQMRTHSTRPWTNAAIYFFAATTGSNGGFYTIDNVSLREDTSASALRTDCLDPSVPPGIPGGGGVPPPSLLGNGDFGTGALAPWGLFGQIVGQVVNGVFEFHRPPGTPSGTILQPTGIGLPARELIVASFQLGNSSTVRKRVTVILHDADFSDLSACTFFLAPGQPLSDYGMRSYTTKAWTSATFSLFPATIGLEPSIRLDNVALRQSTATGATGTECVEPFVPLAIALSPATVGIPTQAQGTLTASISAPAGGGGVTINLLSSDPNAATVPASVLIPAGAMQAPVTVTAGTGTGGATITASATGLASATATVSTALRTMTLDVTNPNLTLGTPVNGTVTLAQPAPAAGVTITLVSSDPNVSVTPTVNIGPGATQGSFVVTANAAVANATMTASAPGFADATLDLTAGFRIWIANASGFWDDAVNWKDGIVPANGDSVLIDRPAAITVTVRVPTAAIDTLQANDTVNVQSTLTVNGTAFFDGGLSINAIGITTLTGTGTAHVRSDATWSSGTVAIASLIVPSGRTLALTTLNGHAFANTAVQSDGTVSWLSTLTFDNSTFQNNGVAIQAGTLQFGGNGAVTNAVGASWESQGGVFLSSGSPGTQTFTNQGQWTKTGSGTMVVFSSVAAVNTGTLTVSSGAFNVSSTPGWTNSGVLAVATGATLNLGRATLQTGTTITGTGSLTATTGPLVLQPDLTLPMPFNLAVDVTGSGKLILNAGMTWSAAGVISNSGLTIPAGQTLTLSSSGQNTLQNSPLVNNGSIVWTGAATLTVNNSTLTNNGTVTTGGTVAFSNSGSVVNSAGATWNAQSSSMVNLGGPGPMTFVNAGLLRRNVQASAFTIGSPIAFTNTGTVDVQTGSVQAAAPWTSSGALSVAAGATLHLNNATLQAGTTITGAGALTLSATTVVPDLTLTQPTTLSGNLTGPGKLTMAAPLLWNTTATLSNSGLTIQAGQTLTITSAGACTFLNSPFVNNGTVTWSGSATVTMTDSTWQNNGTVTSNGTLGFTGTSSVVNAAGAVWIAQSSQMATFGPGTQTFTNLGLFRRSGTIGTFTVASAIGFASSGTIELRLGGLSPGQFDRLALGTPTLGGTLDVQLVNGFVPATSDSFAVATYTSIVGSFATILGNGHVYAPSYGATVLTITKQ